MHKKEGKGKSGGEGRGRRELSLVARIWQNKGRKDDAANCYEVQTIGRNGGIIGGLPLAAASC
jgi:hypothetical protein